MRPMVSIFFVCAVLILSMWPDSAVALPACEYEDIEGVWTGVVDESGFGQYDTRVIISCDDDIVVSYSGLINCSGTWSFNSRAADVLSFTESIPAGQGCLQSLPVVVTITSGGQLDVDYFNGAASSTLSMQILVNVNVPVLSSWGFIALTLMLLTTGVRTFNARLKVL